MHLRKLLLGSCAALALAACQTVPASVHTDTGEALIAALTGLDTGLTAWTALAPLASPAQKATVAKLTAPCPAGVPITAAIVPACPIVATVALARAAYAATDTTSFAALTANLAALAAQIAGLTPPPA